MCLHCLQIHKLTFNRLTRLKRVLFEFNPGDKVVGEGEIIPDSNDSVFFTYWIVKEIYIPQVDNPVYLGNDH